ncbi:hypothetical protein MTO96_004165 [Rhipicephalus appendiculatus]
MSTNPMQLFASCLPGSSRNPWHMHRCTGIRELRAVELFLRSEATPEKSLAVVALSGFRGGHPGLLLSRRGGTLPAVPRGSRTPSIRPVQDIATPAAATGISVADDAPYISAISSVTAFLSRRAPAVR